MNFDPQITLDGHFFLGMAYHAAYGRCSFHFGYVHDGFDEDVKNEEACVQALKHLIAKADTEIGDLEDELAILKCHRKWADFDEKKDPCEVCCAAFRRRIDSLTSLIQELNGNLLHGHCVLTSLEILRPAEKICDIIDALVKSNFTEPREQSQVGDLNNEYNLLITSRSPVIGTYQREQATTSESNLESERQRPTLDRLGKTAESVSEEFTSEAPRHSSKDLSEVKGMGASNAKMPTKSENAGSGSEGKSGFLTSTETFISQSFCQASNDETHSEATAFLHGPSENCVKGLQTGGNGSTLLVVKTEEMLMDEQDGHWTSLQEYAESHSSVPDNQVKDPVDNYLTIANHTQSVADLKNTYGSQKSSLRSILKPTGRKVQRKMFNNPWLRPEPQRKSKKGSLAIEDNIGHLSSPSSKVEERGSSLPVTNRRKKLKIEQDGICGIPIQVPETKKCPPKVMSIKPSSIQSPKVEVAKAFLDGKQGLAADAQDQVKLGLKYPDRVEYITSGITSDCANPDTVRSSTLETQRTIVSPSIDLKSLKQSLSEDPDYLKKQLVSELKKIVRHCQLRGITKLKKEEMIQKLISFFSENSIIQHVSADPNSRTQDLERKDQLFCADSILRTEDLVTKAQHESLDSTTSAQDLVRKDRVSADSASRIQDLKSKVPAEGQADVAVNLSVAGMCPKKEHSA